MRDIDIRRELVRTVKDLHADEADTLYVQELGICQGTARVDFAVVNGRLHGYEIKSERDNLLRLPQQRDIYGAALEFITIVAAESHLEEVLKIVPGWWGVWIARSNGLEVSLSKDREATRNPNVIPIALAQLLWRDETIHALEEIGLSGLRGKTRRHLWQKLAEHVTPEDLAATVRAKLKLRGEEWRASVREESCGD